MRNYIQCFINGELHKLYDDEAFMSVAEYLRYKKGLTGTKVVCAEGDCGACTVLISRMINNKLSDYKSINSCISFMFLLDNCHIVSVEGIESAKGLHPVQNAMVKCHGSQCGYCTPGFICAMANMTEDLKKNGKSLSKQKVKNYLTGNLCRCTGYEPIIEAGLSVNLDDVELMSDRFNESEIQLTLKENASESVKIVTNEKEVFLPCDFKSALSYKEDASYVKLTSGATDLGVLHNKGKAKLHKILSLNNVASAYSVVEDEEYLNIGPKASLTDVESACESLFPEFSRKLHIFASPQIKNNGTLVGNLVNASPIGDTIPFLLASDSKIVLESKENKREIPIQEFYLGGYKEIDLKNYEMVTCVRLKKTKSDFKLYKVSVRKDLDISSVTFACRYKIEKNMIKDISFAMGGVGPIVLQLDSLAKRALGQKFEKSLFISLSKMVENEITPMSDLRGSKDFRLIIAHNLILKFYDDVYSEINKTEIQASI